MARTPANTGLKIWQWNANGFRCRKAVLQQHLQSIDSPPDIIMVQETHMKSAPTLPGYRAHASPPSARDCGKGTAQGVCTFVKKVLTFIKHDHFLHRTTIEHCATEGNDRKPSCSSKFTAIQRTGNKNSKPCYTKRHARQQTKQ